APLARRLPGIAEVAVQLRAGKVHNELTKFRYDVVLRRAVAAASPAAAASILDWQRHGLTLATLETLAREALGSGRQLAVRRIPNPGLAAETAALRLLGRRGARLATAGDLKQALREGPAPEAIDPQRLWELAESLSGSATVSWSESGDDGCIDAVLSPLIAPQ